MAAQLPLRGRPADRSLRKTPEKKVLVVDVAAARTLGDYPLAPRTPA